MQLCSSVLSAPAIIPAPGAFSVSVSYRRVQPVLAFWLIAAPWAWARNFSMVRYSMVTPGWFPSEKFESKASFSV